MLRLIVLLFVCVPLCATSQMLPDGYKTTFKGRVKKATISSYINEETKPSRMETITFDEQGKKLKETLQIGVYDGSSGISYEYKYDSKGKLKERNQYQLSDGSHEEKVIYAVDANGHTEEKTHTYDKKSKSWQHVLTTTYKKDKAGRDTAKVMYYKPENQYITTYIHYADGGKTEERRNFSTDDNGAQVHKKDILTYNDQGNLSIIDCPATPGDELPAARTVIEYQSLDKEGNWIKVVARTRMEGMPETVRTIERKIEYY